MGVGGAAEEDSSKNKRASRRQHTTAGRPPEHERRSMRSCQSMKGWRRRRDSNPRDGFPPTPLAGERLRPLGHVSADPSISARALRTRAKSTFSGKKLCGPDHGPKRMAPALDDRGGRAIFNGPSSPKRAVKGSGQDRQPLEEQGFYRFCVNGHINVDRLAALFAGQAGFARCVALTGDFHWH